VSSPDFASTRIVFNSAPSNAEIWPYYVPVAGRTVARPEDGEVRQNYHEHVFILTLRGAGHITVGRSKYEAVPGDLAWIDTANIYAHGAEQSQQWLYLWVAVSGHGLDALRLQLGFDGKPVVNDCDDLSSLFQAAFDELSEPKTCDPGSLNALVSAMLAKVSSKRGGLQPSAQSTAVSQVANQVRKELHRSWSIPELAKISGLSPSQLFRRFKSETGSSPMGWLRQERMTLASYLLRTTDLPVSQVALQSGYQDPFHFSRDFKRVQGVPPRAYRAGF
jgi:AraC family transcriptional regulator of arabinose operon